MSRGCILDMECFRWSFLLFSSLSFSLSLSLSLRLCVCLSYWLALLPLSFPSLSFFLPFSSWMPQSHSRVVRMRVVNPFISVGFLVFYASPAAKRSRRGRRRRSLEGEKPEASRSKTCMSSTLNYRLKLFLSFSFFLSLSLSLFVYVCASLSPTSIRYVSTSFPWILTTCGDHHSANPNRLGAGARLHIEVKRFFTSLSLSLFSGGGHSFLMLRIQFGNIDISAKIFAN